MKWLGIDLEVNKLNDGNGVWNCGIALFSGRQTLDHYNIFCEEFWSQDEKNGYGAKYNKTRDGLRHARRPVWVETAADMDCLVSSILLGWKFSRSFGYNSSVFDLGKMANTMPLSLALVQKKPHLDLMPLAQAHLLGRKSYRAYWEAQVKAGNTNEGNPEFCKFGAELVLNYIADLRTDGWKWKNEEHIGCEDLIDFEYPILHYFTRILKKAKPVNAGKPFRKWEE